jgi:hypothetical protein
MTRWVSRPDDVDALIARWSQHFPHYFKAEAKTQYSGRPVWALTVTDHTRNSADRPGAIFFKPHAHEPAPIAAQLNFISQLLTAQHLDGTRTDLPRAQILAETVLCFMPDANPAGTAAAPVAAWDGTQYTDEEFIGWAFGVDPETGEMWTRVDTWDDTVEDPLPTRYGIVYEQVSAHQYVEPNRHHASTLFRWLFELRERRTWDRLLSLHQMEFTGQTTNALAILPCLYDEQAAHLQQAEKAWAERIVTAWAQLPHGNPVPDIKPLDYTGRQRQYFVDCWGDIYKDSVILISEIRNNSVICPPPLQQALNEQVIKVTVAELLAHCQ